MKKFYSSILFLILLVVSESAFAQLKTFTGNGNWSNPNRWTPIGVPSFGATIVISGTCSLDVAPVAGLNTFTISSGDTVIVVANSGTNITCPFNLDGNLIFQNSNVNFTGTITYGANSEIAIFGNGFTFSSALGFSPINTNVKFSGTSVTNNVSLNFGKNVYVSSGTTLYNTISLQFSTGSTFIVDGSFLDNSFITFAGNIIGGTGLIEFNQLSTSTNPVTLQNSIFIKNSLTLNSRLKLKQNNLILKSTVVSINSSPGGIEFDSISTVVPSPKGFIAFEFNGAAPSLQGLGTILLYSPSDYINSIFFATPTTATSSGVGKIYVAPNVYKGCGTNYVNRYLKLHADPNVTITSVGVTMNYPAGAVVGSPPFTVFRNGSTTAGTANTTSFATSAVSGSANFIGNWSRGQMAPCITKFEYNATQIFSTCTGVTIDIIGAGFTGASSVKVNGTAVTSFTVVDDSKINATIGAGTSSGVVAVTTPAGTSSTPTLTIEPLVSPTVMLPPTQCTGSTQPFSIASPFAGATYSWSFPAGTSIVSGAGTSNVNVMIGNTSGAITVNETKTNGCVNTGSSSLTPFLAPSITIPPASASICTGATYFVNVTAGGTGLTYQWRKGGVVIAGATAMSYSKSGVMVSDAGNYDVVVTNACSSITSPVSILTVNTIPNVPSIPTGNVSPCSGASEMYTTMAVPGATTYVWTLPGGWLGTSNTTSIPTTVGASSGGITVTAGNGCGNSAPSMPFNATVQSIPGTPTTFTGNLNPCEASPSTYTVASVPGATSYVWTVPGGWSGSLNTPTPSLNATVGFSSGTISVYATNACGNSPTFNSSPITVQNVPTTPTFTTNPTTGCVGFSSTFNINSSVGAANYHWAWGDAAISSGIALSQSHTYSAAGNYVIEVYASNLCGNSTTASYNFTVNSAPVAPGAITGPSDICINTISNAYSVAPVAGASAYSWTLSGSLSGSSPSNNISVSAGIVPGSYTIVAVAHNSCGASSGSPTFNVNVRDLPVVGITGSTAHCPSTVGTYTSNIYPGGSYFWTTPAGWVINSGSGTSALGFTSGLSGSGYMKVMITDQYGCVNKDSLLNTISTPPAQPSVSAGYICNSGTALVSAGTISSLTHRYYTVPTGGTPEYTSAPSTTSSYTTPTLFSTTNYYIEAYDGLCSSTRAIATVNQNILPTDPMITDNSGCVGSNVNLTAGSSTGSDYYWYTSPFGGTSIYSELGVPSSNYNVTSIVSTTTYYVEASDGMCSSNRVAVTATALMPPSIIDTTNTLLCGVGGGNIHAFSDMMSEISWWDAPTSGTQVWSDISTTSSTFSTPVLGTTTTYWVQAAVGACSSGVRIPVVVTINLGPNAPIGLDDTICIGSSGIASANVATPMDFKWYDSFNNIIHSENGVVTSIYSYGSPFATTQYTVEVFDGTCTSLRDTLVITVNPLPLDPTVTSDTTCGPGNVTLGASSLMTGTFNWYNVPFGGTAVFNSSGLTSSYNVGPIAVNTNYYVEYFDGQCTSNRVAVEGKVNALPIVNAGLDINGCTMPSYSLTGNVGSAPGVFWNTMGSGTFSTTSSVVTTYTPSTADTANGSVSIVLKGMEGNCFTYDTLVITMPKAPIASLIISSPSSICEGTPINFTINVANGLPPYQLALANYGDVIVTGSSINFSDTPIPGIYNYQLQGHSSDLKFRDANDCEGFGDFTTIIPITVDAVPVVSSTPSLPTMPVCSGNSVNYLLNGANSYFWTSSVISGTVTGNLASGFTPSINDMLSGSGVVEYSVYGVSAAGCSSVTNYVINQQVLPGLLSTLNVTTRDTLCEGMNGIVNVELSESGINYDLFLNSTLLTSGLGNGGLLKLNYLYNQLTPGQNILQIQASTPGCPPVTLNKKDTVQVSQITVPDLVPKFTKLCDGSTSGYIRLPDHTYPKTQWYFNKTNTTTASDLLLGQNDTAHFPFMEGFYYVEITDVYNCKEFGKLVQLQHDAGVIDVSVVGVTQVGTKLSSNKTSTSYQWYANTPSGVKKIYGATNKDYETMFDGSYLVAVVHNNCYLMSIAKDVTGMPGGSLLKFANDDQDYIYLDSPSEVNDVQVGPNPSDGLFTLDYLSTSHDEIKIRLLDAFGQNHYQENFVYNGYITKSIQVENLQSGTYYLELRQGEKVKRTKILIRK